MLSKSSSFGPLFAENFVTPFDKVDQRGGSGEGCVFPRQIQFADPTAWEQAVQTCNRVPAETVFTKVSAKGGHPTGTTAFATQLRMRDTASPSRKIWTSCRDSASALA